MTDPPKVISVRDAFPFQFRSLEIENHFEKSRRSKQ